MAKNLTTIVKSSKHEVSICRDTGMVIIGERINPTGRNTLQAELKAGKFDIVRKDAVAQLRPEQPSLTLIPVSQESMNPRYWFR